MRVHRTQHDRAFVVVPNAAARHAKLSLIARGLFLTLLSLPDNTPVTIDSVTDRVEEGRRSVSKAFKQLEDAGYLLRTRHQDRESGLWRTDLDLFDVPTNRMPTVGEPKGRTIGGSPKGAKNQEKNLLLPGATPNGDGDRAPEASKEEEDSSNEDEQEAAKAAPADAELGRAAQTLSKLGLTDRRLTLSAAEVLRLAPLAAAWLAEGHSSLKIVNALTNRLPEQVDSAAALVSYRLKNQMPAKPQPKRAPAPDTRARCEGCGAVFPAGRKGGICGSCREELDRATEPVTGPVPHMPPTTELVTADDTDEFAARLRRGRALCRAVVASAAA
ncbi:hypothetical protein [Streptomyces sp. NPDC006134]|uniref:hypothetical protein n=1 Tax=Streptomyces sp. NPDC006134 TaxID=3154467 RepID=UPI0033C85819